MKAMNVMACYLSQEKPLCQGLQHSSENRVVFLAIHELAQFQKSNLLERELSRSLASPSKACFEEEQQTPQGMKVAPIDIYSPEGWLSAQKRVSYLDYSNPFENICACSSN